ncbi:unnamed protein product [Didymodactylos carnosus]|uniref:Uncharacterized protein n=1 Tax=Didymodactylos carnosus TaxID=1234261 RepID=A0A815BYI1_9BILA|nr:unnamed protein product [Didymodactylos carnosus]CAF4063241.1 unnamed protein product [Didymodactylos carnosus]
MGDVKRFSVDQITLINDGIFKQRADCIVLYTDGVEFKKLMHEISDNDQLKCQILTACDQIANDQQQQHHIQYQIIHASSKLKVKADHLFVVSQPDSNSLEHQWFNTIIDIANKEQMYSILFPYRLYTKKDIWCSLDIILQLKKENKLQNVPEIRIIYADETNFAKEKIKLEKFQSDSKKQLKNNGKNIRFRITSFSSTTIS